MAADRSVSTRLRGVRELNRAFRQTDEQLPGRLRERLLGVAGTIAGRIAGKLPRKDGRAAGSVRPKATAKGAAITAGGTSAPYFQWLDFGGTVGRGHKRGYNMGAVHREWLGKPGGSGRYVYPTISDARPETIRAVDEAVRETAQTAGFETRGEL